MSQENRGWLATALVLTLGVGIAAFLLQGKPQPELQPVRHGPAPVAEYISRSPARMALAVTTQGTVQPRRQIDLVAQVGGEVEGTSEGFADGDFFAAGEVLVQLEQQDYRFAIERARARVADAQQLLAMEKGRTRQAKREWRDLGDRDANDLFLRVPQLASAEAALRAAKADLGQAELELKRTAVTAPFDGRIRQTMVDVGQFVVPGAAVARIYSTEAVEVRLPLTDRQVGLLDLTLHRDREATAPPIPVLISGRLGGREWQWQGRISRTDASIDTRSRSMYAVAEIEDPFVADAQSGRPPLLIGQFVEARISGREQDNVIAIPRGALRPQDKLWLLDPDDRLEMKDVKVLQADDEEMLVQGDFGGLLRVIVSPLTMALPGMPLNPLPTSTQSGE
jgi:RND family efflux transporter MFP subunit